MFGQIPKQGKIRSAFSFLLFLLMYPALTSAQPGDDENFG